MKCTVISDTHNKHDTLKLKGGDILFHCGDATMLGQPDEVYPFLEWLAKQPYRYKVFIAGNHDLGWEPIGQYMFPDEPHLFRNRYQVEKGLEKAYKKVSAELGLIYLHDRLVEIEGIKIYGTPASQQINMWNTWAFNYRWDGEAPWDQIPFATDILLTHTPPRGILDCQFARYGSRSLAERVSVLPLKYHLFGHIHEGYGKLKKNKTTFINAAIMDEQYSPVHKPINFTYK